ncbi:RodZ domain-containing protein [Nitrincola alkalilacustris]|uniref:RodZ domain-containing protein n=1 Tax=Nitrincola alkalilacustris TaxID=1571224 RepID=UPI00124EC039|nr:RodZ family helix-turn-helix domain-containing protein [Nitrincola alkalilacustris]
MSSEQQEYSEQLFAGEQFTQAREALGLSVEQISQELNLSVKILRAIESGTPQTLPNPVFVRGYIRNYAKRLGLDPDLSARQFEAIPGVNLTPTSVRSAVSMGTRDQNRSPFMRVLTWLLVLAVIAAALWWSGDQYGLFEQGTEAPPERPADAVVVIEHESTSPAVTGQVPTFEAPVQQESQPLSSESSVVLTEEPVEFLPQTQVSEELPTQSEVEVAEALPQAEEATESASQVELTASGLMVSFIDDCWVQIRDAEGASLFAGVARAGSDLDLQGVEPLSVVIGRVDAVGSITYKGESIDLQSMSNRNVARFNLPLR